MTEIFIQLQAVLDNLPTELIAGFIGSGLTFLASWLWKAWKESRGAFSGRWDQLIYTETIVPGMFESPVKHDLLSVKHSNDTIRVDIKRMEPEDQKQREWYFIGRFTNGQIYGYFWSKTIADPSYGTILLRQRERNCFRGFYLTDVTQP